MCFGIQFSNSFYQNSTLSACSLNSEDIYQFLSQVHFVRIGIQPSLGISPPKAQEAKGAPKQAVGPGTVAARVRMATVISATSTLSSQWRNPMQVVRSTDVSSQGTITVCTLSPTPIQDNRTIYDSLAAHLNPANEQTSPEPSYTPVLQLPRLLQGHRLRRYRAVHLQHRFRQLRQHRLLRYLRQVVQERWQRVHQGGQSARP